MIGRLLGAIRESDPKPVIESEKLETVSPGISERLDVIIGLPTELCAIEQSRDRRSGAVNR